MIGLCRVDTRDVGRRFHFQRGLVLLYGCRYRKQPPQGATNTSRWPNPNGDEAPSWLTLFYTGRVRLETLRLQC